MQIYTYKSIPKLYQDAANHFIDLIKSKPDAVIGLATGSSPIKIYDHLIEKYNQKLITFKDVISFNLDEYVGLNHENPKSYAHFMHEHFFKFINIKSENIHIPDGSSSDLNKECDLYNQLLNRNPIDLQILGIGSNGHIAFNEPGTPFNSVTHVIDLDLKTRVDNARFFENLSDVPTKAITMGISNIIDAKKIILIATGKNKATAVKNMVEGPVDPLCPASILQLHKNVHLFLDEDAASKLT